MGSFLLEIETDGSCGPKTDMTIREFQKAHGLVVDGRAGPATRNELKKLN